MIYNDSLDELPLKHLFLNQAKKHYFGWRGLIYQKLDLIIQNSS